MLCLWLRVADKKKVHVDVLSDKAEIPNKADCWHGNGGAGEYGRHPESFLGIDKVI